MVKPDRPHKSTPKSDFYCDHLNDEEKMIYAKVANRENLDTEIALLERLIKKITEQNPANTKDIRRARHILANMSAINQRIKEKGDSRLRQGITSLVKDISIPTGIAHVKDT